MKKRVMVLFSIIIAAVFTSCYDPSPLYGTWADNDGNSIQFIVDETFNAKIKVEDKVVKYQGDYNVIGNVISFSYSDADGKTGKMNSEWDIRGSMMYIEWTVNGITKVLSLYHIN